MANRLMDFEPEDVEVYGFLRTKRWILSLKMPTFMTLKEKLIDFEPEDVEIYGG